MDIFDVDGRLKEAPKIKADNSRIQQNNTNSQANEHATSQNKQNRVEKHRTAVALLTETVSFLLRAVGVKGRVRATVTPVGVYDPART